MMHRIRLLWVQAALRSCVENKYQPFDRRRLAGGSTEWLPERKRFAFSAEI